MKRGGFSQDTRTWPKSLPVFEPNSLRDRLIILILSFLEDAFIIFAKAIPDLSVRRF